MTDPKPTLYLVTFTAEAPVLANDPEAACKLVQQRSDYASERCTVSAAPLDRIPDKWPADAKVLGYSESRPLPTLSDAIAAGLAPSMRAWYLHEVDDGRMPTPDIDGVRVLGKYHERLLLRGLVDMLAAMDDITCTPPDVGVA